MTGDDALDVLIQHAPLEAVLRFAAAREEVRRMGEPPEDSAPETCPTLRSGPRDTERETWRP